MSGSAMHENRSLEADEAQRLRVECGRWLKDLREQAGLSQRELAIAVGLEYYSFISQIESGKGKVPPSHFEAWAAAVHLPPREFARELLRFYEPLYYKLVFGGGNTEPTQAPALRDEQISDLSDRIVRLENTIKLFRLPAES